MADVRDLPLQPEPPEEAGAATPRSARPLGQVLRWEVLLVVVLAATIYYGSTVSPVFLDWTTFFFINLNVGELAEAKF